MRIAIAFYLLISFKMILFSKHVMKKGYLTMLTFSVTNVQWGKSLILMFC